MENDTLEKQDLEFEIDDFSRCLLGGTAIIWIMKCDWRVEITYKYIYIYMYTLYV